MEFASDYGLNGLKDLKVEVKTKNSGNILSRLFKKNKETTTTFTLSDNKNNKLKFKINNQPESVKGKEREMLALLAVVILLFYLLFVMMFILNILIVVGVLYAVKDDRVQAVIKRTTDNLITQIKEKNRTEEEHDRRTQTLNNVD